MIWKVEPLDAIVAEEIEALPKDMKARLERVAQLISSYGLENIREPHVKHIEGQLWEIRVKGKDGISRALYVTATPKRVVILRVFIKKSQKTPRREIEIAFKRAQEIDR